MRTVVDIRRIRFCKTCNKKDRVIDAGRCRVCKRPPDEVPLRPCFTCGRPCTAEFCSDECATGAA